MLAKKLFFVVSLIMLIGSICGTAEAEVIYAGGSNPGIVYEYLGGTSWEQVSQELGRAVLCLCEHADHLYAGTMLGEANSPSLPLIDNSSISKKELFLSRALSSADGMGGQVWRYEGTPNEWTLIGDNLDNQVCSLIVFRGTLYAGTAWGGGRLYRYDGGTTWTIVVDYASWSGFRSLYVWDDILYIGDIGLDNFGHYDGVSFTEDAGLGGSCVWDYEVYDNNLYASAYNGRIHRSLDGTTWTTIRNYQDGDSWELETFQDYLYVTTGPKLEIYNGSEFSLLWTEPDGYEIVSMINTGDALILGTGGEAGYNHDFSRVGRVYTYNGDDVQLISSDMGSGIQSLYTPSWLDFTKDDGVNDGNCVGPGDEITYTIDYNYPAGPNCPDINDVNIIDYLPDEVYFNSADSNGVYDPCSHTVTWIIGTLSPGDAGSIKLKVKVKKWAQPDSTITNECELRSGEQVLDKAEEDTSICYPPPKHLKWSQPPIEIDPDPCSLNPPVYCGWDVNSHHELLDFECWGPNWPRQCHGDADNQMECDDVIVDLCYYVTLKDFDILKAAWGSVYGDPCRSPERPYDPCADFDRDLIVGPSDVRIWLEWKYVPEPPWGDGVPADCNLWSEIPPLGGTEYYDLFAVSLSPKGFYWDLVEGGYGDLTDPLISLEPAGEPNIDPCTPLGGIAWGFGGLDWDDLTVECDKGGPYDIDLMGEPNYYLSVVLDTATLPKHNGTLSSWGTISNIIVKPWDANANDWGEPIEPNWIISSPDLDGTEVNMVDKKTTVKLAINDFNEYSLVDTQEIGIWGAGAELPPADGYQVKFNTDVCTMDSYDPCGPTGILTWHVAADDFRCLENMPVTSVHWWGSYIGWDDSELPENEPIAWRIGFWSNVSDPDPCDPNTYSYPEELLWQIEVRAHRVEVEYAGQDNHPNHPNDSCFQYQLELLEDEVFWQHKFLDQTEDDTFWLSIAAVYPLGAPVDFPWGWKTRPAGWMDGAVKCYPKNPHVGIVLDPNSVEPIEECGQSYDLSFELDTDPTYIKAEQAYDSIRHWPHYEDELSMAEETIPGMPQIIRLVADDLKCEKQTPITAAVWWGSYLGYNYEAYQCDQIMPPPVKPEYFLLQFWTDVPDPDPNDPCTFSHPNEVVWEYEAYDYYEVLVGYDKHPDGDSNEPVFRYSARIRDPNDWFCQEDVNDIYWFSVVAVYDTTDPCYPWGWTNHKHVFRDDAVAGYLDTTVDPPLWVWTELYSEQAQESVDMSFILFTDCFPCCHEDYQEWLLVGRPSCWCCPRQCHGDATCDGCVNFADLVALKESWMKCCGEPGYNCCVDFNHDCYVNFQELVTLKKNWMTCGYTPPTGNQYCP